MYYCSKYIAHFSLLLWLSTLTLVLSTSTLLYPQFYNHEEYQALNMNYFLESTECKPPFIWDAMSTCHFFLPAQHLHNKYSVFGVSPPYKLCLPRKEDRKCILAAEAPVHQALATDTLMGALSLELNNPRKQGCGRIHFQSRVAKDASSFCGKE